MIGKYTARARGMPQHHQTHTRSLYKRCDIFLVMYHLFFVFIQSLRHTSAYTFEELSFIIYMIFVYIENIDVYV